EIKETKLTEVTYLPITREMLEQLFSNSETKLTEVTYLPITREMLEQLFSNSAKKDKHKLVKKRRR
ncbi:hypothetical protein DW075_21690, partial [Bacteroides xylanisolvens]